MLETTPPHTDATDRRSAPRVDTANFVGYVCLDEDGVEISEGHGWATNLSRSGIRVETFRSVETPKVLLLMAGLRDRILEFKAKVVYARRAGHRRYVYGMQILATPEARHAIITEMIRTHIGRDRRMLRDMSKDFPASPGAAPGPFRSALGAQGR
ncbi:MAG: hypothetical protein K9M82_00660 [Deltaproteobacteria bacterium]|nr:hypothetical protein [Deltaproteobacteria bacterium]